MAIAVSNATRQCHTGLVQVITGLRANGVASNFDRFHGYQYVVARRAALDEAIPCEEETLAPYASAVLLWQEITALAMT